MLEHIKELREKFKSEIELELLLSRYGDINDKDKYEFQN